MSETTSEPPETIAQSDDETTTGSVTTDQSSPPPSTSATSTRDVQNYLYWGALAGFVLLAVAATLQLYASGTRIIRIWVAPDFEPLFVAAFNLIVLLLAVIGISWVRRQMGDS